jgi:prepilin-type N-terminal cleavage/methylation domain-containing protein
MTYAAIKKSFTLIELLVVVAIIGILAAVGAPIFQSFMQDSKDIVVENNHKMMVTHLNAELLKIEVGKTSIFGTLNNPKSFCKNAAKYYQEITGRTIMVGSATYDRITCQTYSSSPGPGNSIIRYGHGNGFEIVSKWGECSSWANCTMVESQVVSP